jgi:hypothetical protein
LQQITVFEKNGPLNLSRGIRNKPEHAEGGNALARSRLTHQADDFTGKNVEVHTVDSFSGSGLGLEISL